MEGLVFAKQKMRHSKLKNLMRTKIVTGLCKSCKILLPEKNQFCGGCRRGGECYECLDDTYVLTNDKRCDPKFCPKDQAKRDGVCVKCNSETENCSNCKFQTLECIECSEGYSLDSNTKNVFRFVGRMSSLISQLISVRDAYCRSLTV